MQNSIFLIDFHVHIHNCFNLDEFFHNVFLNFSKCAKLIGKSQKWTGVLFLSEIKEVNYFDSLKESLKCNKPIIDSNKYKILETSEDCSIIISNKCDEKVIIIAGKQIITEDKVEVLALGTTNEFNNGYSLSITIEEINKVNAIPVLPWGVGKWLGKRKKIVQQYLAENNEQRYFIGDNSGRPRFWSEPNLFKLGNQSNHFVLRGSDALPILSQVNKTASFGSYTYGVINQNKPLESIKNILENLTKSLCSFGRLENVAPFFINQFTMQLKKYL